MAQQVKAYAVTDEDLNLNPGTHIEKENNPYSSPVTPTQVLCPGCAHTHTHTHDTHTIQSRPDHSKNAPWTLVTLISMAPVYNATLSAMFDL